MLYILVQLLVQIHRWATHSGCYWSQIMHWRCYPKKNSALLFLICRDFYPWQIKKGLILIVLSPDCFTTHKSKNTLHLIKTAFHSFVLPEIENSDAFLHRNKKIDDHEKLLFFLPAVRLVASSFGQPAIWKLSMLKKFHKIIKNLNHDKAIKLPLNWIK